MLKQLIFYFVSSQNELPVSLPPPHVLMKEIKHNGYGEQGESNVIELFPAME